MIAKIIKTRKKLMMLLSVVLCASLLPFAAAERVGVVVTFPDGSSFGECLNVAKATNGYEVIKKIALPTIWSEEGAYGHQLCQINGIGDYATGTTCTYNGKYWGFFTKDNNHWEYMPVGFDGGDSCWNGDSNSYDGYYCAAEGDLVGLRYGEFGEMPTPAAFSNICSPLTVKDITIKVDGKKQRATEEGGRIEATPNSTITFNIELSNNNQFEKRMTIESIEAVLAIENIDSGDDLEEEVEFEDIKNGKTKEKELTIQIPLFVEEDNYPATLKITGTTEKGIAQEREINFSVGIKKESNGLRITRLQLQQESSCPGESNSLTAEIINLGKKDETNIGVKVESKELELIYNSILELESSGDPKTSSKLLQIPLNVPPSAAPGAYSINVSISGKTTRTEQAELIVQDCLKEQEENIENQTVATSAAIDHYAPNEQAFIQKNSESEKTMATPQQIVYYQRNKSQDVLIPTMLGIFLAVTITTIVLLIKVLQR